MDFEPAFGFDLTVDTNKDLNAIPQSGLDYLRRVAFERSHCPSVVVVEDIKLTHNKLHASSQNQMTEAVNDNLIKYVISDDWKRWHLAEFSEFRSSLERIREAIINQDRKQNIKFSCPDANKEKAWEMYCFHFKNELSSMPNQQPNGTPPALRLLLSLNAPQIDTAIQSQVKVLTSGSSLSSERARWLFALLSVLQKPLDADICATLRQFAKWCKSNRSSHATDSELHTQFSLFILLISDYFGQNDLSD